MLFIPLFLYNGFEYVLSVWYADTMYGMRFTIITFQVKMQWSYSLKPYWWKGCLVIVVLLPDSGHHKSSHCSLYRTNSCYQIWRFLGNVNLLITYYLTFFHPKNAAASKFHSKKFRWKCLIPSICTDFGKIKKQLERISLLGYCCIILFLITQ